MGKEIIIKTEIVDVEKLEGREKQIYEAGLSHGFNYAIDRNKENAYRITNLIMIIIISIVIISIIVHN